MSGRPGQRPATWRGPRWSWASKNSDVRVAHEHLDGRVTLAELLAHVAEVAPHASHDDVTVSAHLSWTRPATAEELAERERWEEASRERHREWQARTMRALIDEYGPDTSTWPAATPEELAEWRAKHGGLRS